MFIQNKYTIIYFNILNKAALETRSKKNGYFEKHHIIPKCSPLNGSDTKENIILLTAKEHYLCHLLLVKMTEGNARYKMACALNNMSRKSEGQERFLSAGRYEKIKRILSQSKTGTTLSEAQKKNFQNRVPWNKGKTKNTDARIKKYAENMCGENHHRPLSGTKRSNATKEKISNANSGNDNPFYGRKHTEETKKKMSLKAQGNKNATKHRNK